MHLTYRYRALPSRRQHHALEKILEAQRQLYNAALEERIGAYRRGVRRTYVDQTKALTEWRSVDSEAAELACTLQRATLKRLDHAYLDFFRRVRTGKKPGFPRFRGPGQFKSFGFRVWEAISLHGNRLRFKGLPGTLRIHLHRPLPESPVFKRCTFRRDAKGWLVGFEVEVSKAELRQDDRAVGVDLGILSFAALSDGSSIPSVRAARRGERRQRQLHRSLSRKQMGSNGQRKARAALRRFHEKTARIRNDHLHRASASLCRKFGVVVVEALHVRGLAQGRLAKDIHDASWSQFICLLKYKAERAGTRVFQVDPRGTSQDCSGCGACVPKKLEEREHKCPKCGVVLDRDLNAARNILHRAGVGPGLRNVANGGMRAGGNLGQC
jgi:putative transposase